jgi:two-component system chemotaxis response regulator CheY
MAKILIVDDSPTVRKYHGLVLNAMGYRTCEAADGSEALEALITENVDMVITDINMPRMNGFEFIAELREMPEYADLPVMIVSSQELSADMVQGSNLGVNSYLVKPTDIETLAKWVRRLLPELAKRER